MNAEISRIRKNKNLSEVFDYKPRRIDFDRTSELLRQLNINLSELYSLRNEDVKIDIFIDKFIANIYIILNMFDEMGVYPDYFFDEIVKMNIEYKKISGDRSIRGDYQLFRDIRLSARVCEDIKSGLEKGYYRVQAYPKKDINEGFLEILGLFQTFNMPYNINTKEQCKKVFNELQHNHMCIIESFYNSEDIIDDIEFLSRLLFEYMTFFVSMGIYPKEYLDKYIDKMNNKQEEHNKSK